MADLVRRSSHVAIAGKQKEEDEKMAEAASDDRDDEIAKLRKRWELASVYNFLTVFEPVIGKLGKLSAEEIEMGLVTPHDSLAQIHIALKDLGIPPASKALDGSDAWVTVLCKKLVTWWPWVAEGKMPLVVAKGEEIPCYKGLDPTERLLMLKALCELRADQDDAVAYINDALKEGTEISSFRKEKIGGDTKRTSYWYDGNTIICHRLYKEVIVIESKKNVNGKEGSSLPNISFQWETVATNLEEFQKVTDELSSSKVAGERDAAKSIETDAIPALEKLQKKKEREVKKKLSQERQQNLLANFYAAGVARSCRNRRPVNYTFDRSLWFCKFYVASDCWKLGISTSLLLLLMSKQFFYSYRKVLECVVCGRLKSAFQIASRSGSVADVQYVAHQALHANALPVLDMCKQWLAQYM